jgi:hypothetical protein
MFISEEVRKLNLALAIVVSVSINTALVDILSRG